MDSFPPSLGAIFDRLSLTLLADDSQSYAFLAFFLDRGTCNRPSRIISGQYFEAQGAENSYASAVIRQEREYNLLQEKMSFLLLRFQQIIWSIKINKNLFLKEERIFF